jgi:hypothetical protein
VPQLLSELLGTGTGCLCSLESLLMLILFSFPQGASVTDLKVIVPKL